MLNDLIAENIPMGVLLTQDGKICHVNQWGLDYIGYKKEELEGASFFEMVHPDDRELLFERYNIVLSGKDTPKDRRYRILSSDGRIIHAMFRSAIIEYNGKPALMSYLVDETRNWEDENAIKKNEEKYRALVDNIGEGIAVVAGGNIRFINETLRKIVGDLETIADIPFLNFVHPEDQPRIIERHRQRMEGKDVNDRYEVRLVDPKGTIYHCMIQSVVITWEGEPAIQAAIQDLTAWKEAEKEKKGLEKRLVRMEKMEALGILAGGVAHDLNNVLSGVVSYPELLLMDLPKTHPFAKPLELIHSSGQKASAIVDDLLALARRGVMATNVLNMNNVIADYLNSPAFKTMISCHSGVTLETFLAPDLLNIKGSDIHLQKSIMNLVLNAIEAQPSGGSITISTRNTYIDAPVSGYDTINEGEYVVLKIEDAGIGINSKDMQRIFEPFYTKKVMGRSGTGLGMAVVWGTVQDHNGYIHVESRENNGTTFFLYFPVFREEIEDKKTDPAPVDLYMGNRERVLVIDDIKDQREIAEFILQRLNYVVHTVPGGKEAVAYLKDNTCDILLLDMIMEPGIDGLETYRRILKIHPKQKAVVASGFSEDERVKKILSLGAGRYIKKPYAVEQLGRIIKEELLK